jgi:PhnB protein
MENSGSTFFAPQLIIKSGVHNIDFYIKGTGAVELRRFTNDDGSVHVSELSINGALFHLHEENHGKGSYSPEVVNGITTIIGLFVTDVDAFMKRAIEAGATEISAPKDYEYGYRQGEFEDPFGHRWLIESRVK